MTCGRNRTMPRRRLGSTVIRSGSESPWGCSIGWRSTVNEGGLQKPSIVRFLLAWSGGVLTLRGKLSSVGSRPRDAAQTKQHRVPGILQRCWVARRRPGRFPGSRHTIALPCYLQSYGPPPERERPEESTRRGDAVDRDPALLSAGWSKRWRLCEQHYSRSTGAPARPQTTKKGSTRASMPS